MHLVLHQYLAWPGLGLLVLGLAEPWQRPGAGLQHVCSNLREFVKTHVMLTPGACGSGVWAGAPDTTLLGSRGESWGCLFLCAGAVISVFVLRKTVSISIQEDALQVSQDDQRDPKGWAKGDQGDPKGSQREPKST